MKKILKTTLIIALGLVIGGVSYTFTQKDKSLLLGDLSDALPGEIVSVDFADPSGSVTPSNGIVTINSVDYVTTIPETGQADQSDILASSIFFVASPTMNCHAYDADQPNCPLSQGCVWESVGSTCDPIVGAGVQINGNKIIVPSGNYPVNVNIHASNGVRATGSAATSDDLLVTADLAGAVANGDTLAVACNNALGATAVASAETATDITIQVDCDSNPSTWDNVVTAANLAGIFASTVTSPANGSDNVVTADAQTITLAGGVDATGTTPLNVSPLTINSLSCENLQMLILRGQGSGAYTGSETLPTSARSLYFDFDPPAPGPSISSIVLSNPIAAETGQQTFAITFNFVDTLEEERAVITSSTGDGSYTISVKDEGVDTVATSENFVYAINDLLGIASPFIAVLEPGSRARLITKELGIHTNEYNCMLNNANFPVSTQIIAPYTYETGKCFDEATVGTGAATNILTQPLTMDNTMTQGDTALIYIAGGIGVTEWGTSHPSVMEVVPFGEIGEGGGGGTVQFIPETFVAENVEQINENSGSYNIDCDTEYDDSDPVNIISQQCTIDFVIPVIYDPENDYNTIVYLGDEEIIVPVTLETGATGTLVGTVAGNGTYNYNTGLSIILQGTVSGTVMGNATGSALGLVTGSVMADVSISASIAPGVDLLTAVFQTELVTLPVSEGTIDAEGDFISTVKLVNTEAGITNYAVLYAKRAGTSILTVTDELTCVAALEVEVQSKKVILDMVGKDPSDVFELGESVQINAYLGSADGELDENENITFAQGIEWISSNPDVATIDGSGVLSIVAPGITNIMATYYVGDAEIDPVQSDPMTIKVSKITGLTIALDEAAQAMLTNAELNEAYESVLIILNNPKAAGRTITVEGETFDIDLPIATYNNDSERIEAIIAELESDISGMTSSPAPTVSSVTGLPGILILQPHVDDVNGYIDISTTATKEDLTIFPNFSNGISLPASETFGLMVIADYDNGRTKRLNTTDVTWINTPLNYLEQTALEAGLMKMGGITGTSTVIASYENADGTKINSNQLAVNVGSGPVIEYARRIQSGSITQGSRINLRTKVTDVDTIADISEITTSIVRSQFNTYHSINSDPSAVWFTAVPFEDEVTVESESTPAPVVEGEEGEVAEEVETTTVTLNYKTYSIPIEIPVDEYLYDGNYNLVLSISDASNHTSNFVLPIYIGEQASGDVSGDGNVNMVDVIFAFQIASNPSAFTQAQLEAADMDHMGGVTMIDVILLFNKATSN